MKDYEHTAQRFWLIVAIIATTMFIGNIYAQTKEEVYNYCKEIGIQNPEFVTAQSQLETGYYNPKSIGVKQNNLFCFKWGTFLTFNTWQESINYYYCWMERKGIYFYKDLKTLLLNEWGAGNMKEYISKVEWIERNY